MINDKRSKKTIFLKILFLLFFIFFSISVFKNIAYPLLWSDEGETVMFATRILRFGFPKIHDGKNVLYLLNHPDKQLGQKENIDAYIGSVWGQYYFASPWVRLLEGTEDIYVKTAFLRIPFAAVGILGLIMFMSSVREFFKSDSNSFVLFLIISIEVTILFNTLPIL